MKTATVTTVLDASQPEVFAYLADIAHLPEWATEFARELRHDPDGYTVVDGLGEFHFTIRVRPEPPASLTCTPGRPRTNLAVFPTRAVALPDGTERLQLHDVPGARDAGQALRRPVLVAQARIHQHRATLSDRSLVRHPQGWPLRGQYAPGSRR